MVNKPGLNRIAFRLRLKMTIYGERIILNAGSIIDLFKLAHRPNKNIQGESDNVDEEGN